MEEKLEKRIHLTAKKHLFSLNTRLKFKRKICAVFGHRKESVRKAVGLIGHTQCYCSYCFRGYKRSPKSGDLEKDINYISPEVWSMQFNW